jgi:hypothetical protein
MILPWRREIVARERRNRPSILWPCHGGQKKQTYLLHNNIPGAFHSWLSNSWWSSTIHSDSSMAFPIPSHLPRQQDVSSKMLSKIDEATGQSLNATLASSWVAELDQTIQLTKVQRPTISFRQFLNLSRRNV